MRINANRIVFDAGDWLFAEKPVMSGVRLSIIFRYPELPHAEKAQFEHRILARPFKYSLSEFEHLLATDFPFEQWDHLWLERYCELARFHAQYGHLRVGPSEIPLAHWMSRQRQRRLQGRIVPDQQRALNRLGFIWEPVDEKWQENYESYRNHVTEKGRASHKLTNWLNAQRLRWDHLSPKKRKLLLQCGFKRDPFGQRRATNLKDMEVYFRKHGHLMRLPIRLSKFSESMRRFQSQGRLDPSYQTRLDQLKFKWVIPRQTLPLALRWEHHHAQVAAYLQTKSPDVPPLRKWEDPKLAGWVLWQRNKERWARLSVAQKQKLTALGLAPGAAPIQRWEAKYQKAVTLFKNRGFRTRRQWEEVDPSVGRWLRGQKERWETLAPWKRQKLQTLGVEGPASRALKFK